MEINKRDNILEFNDARIVYRNFTGAPSKFNQNGERSFSIVIGNGYFNNLEMTSDEICDELEKDGWHIKRKPPVEEGEAPFNTLPVKVKFGAGRNPAVYLDDGVNIKQINEDLVSMIDDLNISGVDMDIRPYNWTMGNNSGTTAYLQSMCVKFIPDRFAARLNNMGE